MRIRASDDRAGVLGFRVVHRSGQAVVLLWQHVLGFRVVHVAVRLSCTSEARATQWRILVQVAELVWAEIPGARARIFKSPGL